MRVRSKAVRAKGAIVMLPAGSVIQPEGYAGVCSRRASDRVKHAALSNVLVRILRARVSEASDYGIL